MIRTHFTTLRPIWCFAVALLFVLLAGCTPSPNSDPAPEATRQPSPTPAPSASPTPRAVLNLPPPGTFTSDILREGITPSAYIEDTCSYLAMRWDPEKSAPGTVVATIMFHTIYPYQENFEDEPSAISRETFDDIVRQAERYGFETITTQELADFLHNNARIPQLSMILMMDDRRVGSAKDLLLPVAEDHDWTATLAWPIGDTDIRRGLWGRIEDLNDTGYFDIQSHGLNHIYITDRMDEATIREEIYGSIPILEEHFGEKPIALIWPGGNYTELAVEIAKEAGFQLGFTIDSRGPLQFNWIPQGGEERAIGEPLMLLPRFWSSAAVLNLYQAVEISEAASEFARKNYAEEAAWYHASCGGELPPFSEFFPADQPAIAIP